MLIANGQNKEKDIQNHADIWIKQNQELFNKWIKEAKALQK
jgi:glycine betaine/proline transport system substrate-binding protein